jgi:hypothetical protein
MKVFVAGLSVLAVLAFAYSAVQRLGPDGTRAAVMAGLAIVIVAPVCVILGYILGRQGGATPVIMPPEPQGKPQQPTFVVMPPGATVRELPQPPVWEQAPGPRQFRFIGDDDAP